MYIPHLTKHVAIVCEKDKFADRNILLNPQFCYTVAVWYKAQLNWQRCLLSLNAVSTTLN